MVQTTNNNNHIEEALKSEDINVTSNTEVLEVKPKHLYLFQFKVEDDIKAALMLASTMAEAQTLAQKELEDKFPDVDSEKKALHSATMITDQTVATIAREVLKTKVRLGWFDAESGQSWSIV